MSLGAFATLNKSLEGETGNADCKLFSGPDSSPDFMVLAEMQRAYVVKSVPSVDSVKWSPAVLCCTVSVPDYKGNPPLEPPKISTSPAAHSPLRALLSHYRNVPQYDTIGRVRIAPPKRLFHLGPDHSASTETRVDSPHSWPLLPRILFPFPVAPA